MATMEHVGSVDSCAHLVCWSNVVSGDRVMVVLFIRLLFFGFTYFLCYIAINYS